MKRKYSETGFHGEERMSKKVKTDTTKFHKKFLEKFKNNDKFLIFTDLEPDDIKALELLYLLIPANAQIHVVVGEGNAFIKEKRMHHYNKVFKRTGSGAKIYRGYGMRNLKFDKDGEDCLTKEEIAECEMKFKDENGTDVEKSTLQEISKILEDGCTVFSLKPPRELMYFYKTVVEPGTTTTTKDSPKLENIFINCQIVGYMSFNLRCMLKRKDEDVRKHRYKGKDIVQMFERFKICWWFETYFSMGSDNTLTAKETNWKKISKTQRRLIEDWDKCLVEDCVKTIDACMCSVNNFGYDIWDIKDNVLVKVSNFSTKLAINYDTKTRAWTFEKGKNQLTKDDQKYIIAKLSQMHRNKKCKKQIESNPKGQFVFADPAAVLAILCDESVWTKSKVSFDKRGYTKICEPENDECGILVIQTRKEDQKKYKKWLVSIMEDIY